MTGSPWMERTVRFWQFCSPKMLVTPRLSALMETAAWRAASGISAGVPEVGVGLCRDIRMPNLKFGSGTLKGEVAVGVAVAVEVGVKVGVTVKVGVAVPREIVGPVALPLMLMGPPAERPPWTCEATMLVVKLPVAELAKS